MAKDFWEFWNKKPNLQGF